MALFSSDAKESLKRLASKEFGSVEVRDEMLASLDAAEELRARDVAWMLFRPDRAIRDAGARLLQKYRDPETLPIFLNEAKGKPEAAIRAAVGVLFSLGLQTLENDLGRVLLAPPAKETKETRELQDIARRVLFEVPTSRTIDTLLWQLVSNGFGDDRIQYLTRLAQQPIDERGAARWHRLAQDHEPAMREKALEVLAAKAPNLSVSLFVQQLPVVSYNTQQMLIDALARVSSMQPPEFADQLLPLVAAGDAASRTAALKILLSMQNPAAVVKRYIRYTKNLAGFVRDRALDSLRVFGPQLVEPAIDLLSDPDDELRAAALAVASTFDDPRLVPATIALLKDSDWWIRIAAAETLGRLKDARAVDALIAALADADVKWAAVEALGHIADPRALTALGRMLSDPQPNVRIEVMQALRNFNHPQVAEALKKIATHDPERSVRMRALDLLDEMARRDHGAGAGAVRSEAMAVRSVAGEPKLHTYFISTRNSGASDFHLSVGQPPVVRMGADLLRAQGEPFTAEQTESMLREILTDQQWETLRSEQQVDFCYFIPQAGRYRSNVFLDHRGYNGVFRVIPEKPPTISELGLPAHLEAIADFHQGLVLICGPSGSGKSTTLAALVNLFNETRSDHVLMMEDPVEFVHPFKNCLINQREVGSHTKSFARALRAALREDPDVIVIGELRDNESVALALTAAETGHIVLGTLSSTSAPKAIDRLISSFAVDEQPQIRAALSESLRYVIAQRLLPAKEGRKQVAAFEVLRGTASIANMIRDEKTFQIHSAMQTGRSLGMQTFDDALRDLLKRDQITAEAAYMAALKKEDFESLVSPAFLASTR
jgi:twitching motility protein PilT